MCPLSKAIDDPTRNRDRPPRAGPSTSLPRNLSPLIRVTRTVKVSPVEEALPVRNVSLTKSPTRSARIVSRSSSSLIPSRVRMSSIFSSTTEGRIFDPSRPLKWAHARPKVSPDSNCAPIGFETATRRVETNTSQARGRDLRACQDEKRVLLRTHDVRQVRRAVLGRWKASGMKSNRAILHNWDHDSQTG